MTCDILLKTMGERYTPACAALGAWTGRYTASGGVLTLAFLHLALFKQWRCLGSPPYPSITTCMPQHTRPYHPANGG